jgi:hypothetical protein
MTKNSVAKNGLSLSEGDRKWERGFAQTTPSEFVIRISSFTYRLRTTAYRLLSLLSPRSQIDGPKCQAARTSVFTELILRSADLFAPIAHCGRPKTRSVGTSAFTEPIRFEEEFWDRAPRFQQGSMVPKVPKPQRMPRKRVGSLGSLWRPSAATPRDWQVTARDGRYAGRIPLGMSFTRTTSQARPTFSISQMHQ